MNLFDLHCDTLYRGVKENLEFDGKNTAVDFFSSETEKYVQVFAAFIPDDSPDGFADFVRILNYMKKNNIKPVADANGLKKNRVALFSVENGKALGDNINNLDFMYKNGVRMMTLTWNGKNSLASGNAQKGGLTDFGRNVIKRMNRLKMAVDLSHINCQGFCEAIKISDYPVASHSCFYGLVNHRRNLKDNQAKLIAQKGGIIGIAVYPEFLGKGEPFEQFKKQVKYGLNLGLENNLAIGADLDGGKMHPDLSRTSHFCKLYDYLKKDFGTEITNALFYDNAKKYFEKLLS